MLKKEDYALLFKAMSDETRLNIIEMLSTANLCACHLLDTVVISQPTLSYHMKILSEAGLVTSEKDGNLTRYFLQKEMIVEINNLTQTLLRNKIIAEERLDH